MTVDVNKDYNNPILAEDDGTLRVKGWNSDGDCDILPGSLIGKTKFTLPGATATLLSFSQGTMGLGKPSFA